MSIMVPEEVGNLFMVLTGEQWPQIDEDRLRQLSEAWQTASARLSGELGPELARALENIRSQTTGQAARMFADRMEPFVSSPGHIYTAATAFQELSKFLKDTSLQVEYVKLVSILSLIALLAEIAWAVAMAVPTFGASMTQLAAYFAVTRFLISRWWGRLLMRIVQAQLVGIGLQLGIDVAAQGIQFAKGSRDEWDKKATGTAAGVGALGGALALPFSALGGMFGNLLGKGMVKGLGDKVDQKILKEAAQQAATKHTKDFPHVSMAKFADMVSNSMSSAAGNALGRNAKYAGMSLKGMWADKFGKGLAETIEEGLHEFFTEGLYGAMTGQGFDANPFAFTAGMASGGASNLGSLIGDASFGSLKPPAGGGRANPDADSESGGLLDHAADIDGAGKDQDLGSHSDSSGRSGGVAGDGPREAGSSDAPGRQGESSTSDAPGAVDRSVTSSTTPVPESPGDTSSDGPIKPPQESTATVGAESSADGRSGAVANDQRSAPVPGGQPVPPDSSPANGINGSPDGQPLPTTEPGGAPGQTTPANTTSPDASPVGGTSPADGAQVQGPGQGEDTPNQGAVGDSITSGDSSTVPDSAHGAPPSGTDTDAQVATSPDTAQQPPTTDPSSHEQSADISSTPNQSESAESAGPAAATPAPLPALVTDGAAVVTVPAPETTVDGLLPGIAPDSRSVVAVSETNSGNDVVLPPGTASQLATSLGKDVTALTPGQGRRGPRWKTFPADGSRPKPAGTGAPITVPSTAPAEQPTVGDVPTGSSSSVPAATSPAAKTPESRTVSVDASGRTVEPEPVSEGRDAPKDPASPSEPGNTVPKDVANPVGTPPAAKPGSRDPGTPKFRTTGKRGEQSLIKTIPGGRGHVVGGGERPVLHQIAADLPKDDSVHTIVAMGSKNGIATDSGRVSDAELADLIAGAREPGDTRPIRLFACDLGAGGKDSQGARLAQASNTPVLAPRGWVWQSGSPHWRGLDGVVSSAETLPDGTLRPKLPPDGSWVLYTPNPDGTVESRDLGPHLPGNLGDEIRPGNVLAQPETSDVSVVDKTWRHFADQARDSEKKKRDAIRARTKSYKKSVKLEVTHGLDIRKMPALVADPAFTHERDEAFCEVATEEGSYQASSSDRHGWGTNFKYVFGDSVAVVVEAYSYLADEHQSRLEEIESKREERRDLVIERGVLSNGGGRPKNRKLRRLSKEIDELGTKIEELREKPKNPYFASDAFLYQWSVKRGFVEEMDVPEVFFRSVYHQHIDGEAANEVVDSHFARSTSASVELTREEKSAFDEIMDTVNGNSVRNLINDFNTLKELKGDREYDVTKITIYRDGTNNNLRFDIAPKMEHWTHLADPAVADTSAEDQSSKADRDPRAPSTSLMTQLAAPAGSRDAVRPMPIYEIDMDRVARMQHLAVAEVLGAAAANLLSKRTPLVLRERVAELLRERGDRSSRVSRTPPSPVEVLVDHATELLKANATEVLRDHAGRKDFVAELLGDHEIEVLSDKETEEFESEVEYLLRKSADERRILRDLVAELNDPGVRWSDSGGGFGRVEIDYSSTQLREFHPSLAYQLRSRFIDLFSDSPGSEFDRMREAFGNELYRSDSVARDDALDAAARYSANTHDFREYDKKFTVDENDRLGLASQLDETDAIDVLLQGNDGFLIGEAHGETQGWQFLRRNLHVLKSKGVDTVYLEHFRHDDYQDYINQYLNGRSGALPWELDTFTKKHDSGHNLKPPSGLRYLLVLAKLLKIRIVGVDSPAARRGAGVVGLEMRANRMNKFAADVIRNDHHRKGKYVVLLGRQHVHTHAHVPVAGHRLSQGIPGVAQLLNAPAVQIDPRTLGPELHLEEKQNRDPKSEVDDPGQEEDADHNVQQDRHRDIERAEATRERTPAGSSYYADAGLRELARQVPDDGRHYTVDVQASPDGHVQIGEHTLTVREFGSMLRRDPHWDGMKPIRLLASKADSSGLARELSRELGPKWPDDPAVTVTAPQHLVWIDSGGRVFSSSQAEDGRPAWPPDGRWITHHSGKVMTYASKGFHPYRRAPDAVTGQLAPAERPGGGDRAPSERSRPRVPWIWRRQFEGRLRC